MNIEETAACILSTNGEKKMNISPLAYYSLVPSLCFLQNAAACGHSGICGESKQREEEGRGERDGGELGGRRGDAEDGEVVVGVSVEDLREVLSPAHRPAVAQADRQHLRRDGGSEKEMHRALQSAMLCQSSAADGKIAK